jgi:ribose 5-phosphate isomerase A
VPLELLAFGAASTVGRLRAIGEAVLRDSPPSPDGGLIADLDCDVGDPGRLAADLDADPGIAGHGLFPPILVSRVLIGGES